MLIIRWRCNRKVVCRLAAHKWVIITSDDHSTMHTYKSANSKGVSLVSISSYVNLLNQKEQHPFY